MTLPYKIQIAKAITNVLNRNLDLPIEGIASKVRVHPFLHEQYSFVVPQEAHLNDPNEAEMLALQKELNCNVNLQYVFRKPFLSIAVDQHQFAYDVLTHKMEDIFSYRKPSKVLIEFSSPNIAKQFHWGHLRSTIIGNFVANINKFARNEVTTMNYLGDWGLQMGMLKVGLEICKFTPEEIAQSPIKKLQEAYVTANWKNEEDLEVDERAKKLFNDLEFADENDPIVKEWSLFRQYTVKELERIYKRLNIQFDHYSWESEYSAKKIQPLIEELKEKKVVVPEYDQSLVTWIDDQLIPFLKMDGSTLYLTRDVAAALDRYERFKFDKMYYVVDTMQRGHFVALVRILEKFGAECASKIEYVPFGRIKAMSTRKGQAVWLDDIINTAQKTMEQKQIQSFTRKADIGGEVADILGKSALIISDLKVNRMRHYEFDWKTAMQPDGYSGVKLQYCHCRLHSLRENCGASLPSECDPKLLQEKEAVALIHAISRFEDALIDSLERFEACFLVSYLFDLSDCINKAFKVLKVKDEAPHIASQRLFLFMKAKEILYTGMKIVGLQPLDQM